MSTGRGRQNRPGVDGHGPFALRQHQQRVHVQLGDLFMLRSQPANPHDGIDQRGAVGGTCAAQAAEQLRRAHFVDHRLRVRAAQRREAETDVGQRFDVDATQAEHDERPEGRIALDADDHLLPAADHLLHLDAADVCAGMRGVRPLQDRRKACPHPLLVLDAHDDPADVGLVQDVGADDLQDDGIAGALRERDGVAGVQRKVFLRRPDAVGLEQRPAVGGVERLLAGRPCEHQDVLGLAPAAGMRCTLRVSRRQPRPLAQPAASRLAVAATARRTPARRPRGRCRRESASDGRLQRPRAG